MSEPQAPYKISLAMQELNDIAGKEDPFEAIQQWMHEREAMVQINEEKNAAHIKIKKLSDLLQFADKLISILIVESGLFLTDRTRQKISAYSEMFKTIFRQD